MIREKKNHNIYYFFERVFLRLKGGGGGEGKWHIDEKIENIQKKSPYSLFFF